MQQARHLLATVMLLAVVGCGAQDGLSPTEVQQVTMGWASLQPFEVSVPADAPMQGEHVDDEPVLLINFWASWCRPCKKELPMLQRLDDEAGIAVVGVTRDVREEYARDALDDADVSYVNWQDDDATYMEQFAGAVPTSAVPSTLVIVEGRAVAVHIGPFDSWDELQDGLRPYR